MLKDMKDCRTSPSYGLTGLILQDVLPLPIKRPHVEETIQNPVIHVGLLLFHGTSNSNIVPPKGVVVVTVLQGIPMPTTSSLIVVSHLHTAQNCTIYNLTGNSISQ